MSSTETDDDEIFGPGGACGPYDPMVSFRPSTPTGEPDIPTFTVTAAYPDVVVNADYVPDLPPPISMEDYAGRRERDRDGYVKQRYERRDRRDDRQDRTDYMDRTERSDRHDDRRAYRDDRRDDRREYRDDRRGYQNYRRDDRREFHDDRRDDRAYNRRPQNDMYRDPDDMSRRDNRDTRDSRDTRDNRDSRRPPSDDDQKIGVVFIRLRSKGDRPWFEFLVEKSRSGDTYGFPAAKRRDDSKRSDDNAVMHITDRIARRGLLNPPRSYADLEPCFRYTTWIHNTLFRVYFIHMDITQRPKPDRQLAGQPPLYWVTSSELVGHVDLGPPSVFGVRVDNESLRLFDAMPVCFKFASSNEPLVLYHGTSTHAVLGIATDGLVASCRPGMLGSGVYFGRWDKALSFSKRDAENNVRAEAGVVVRCIVFVNPCLTMTRSMVCTCGCGKEFVDHLGHHGKHYVTTYVPDNSLPATRRAEWCVHDPDAIVCDGVFSV